MKHLPFPILNSRCLITGVMILLMISISAPDSAAKPASKRTYTVMQPDGTELSIKKYGDEYGHYLTTEDGIPVIHSNGAYYYAIGNGETPMASEIMARPAGSRSADEIKFLSSLDVKGIRANLSTFSNPDKNRARANKLQTRGPGLCSTTFPSEGAQKGLVILVQFRDVKFRTKNPKDYFTNLLNQEGFSENGGTGSARDWFIKNSNGKFMPEFDVYGPVTLTNKMSYYGGNDYWGNDKNPEKMIIEACTMLVDEIDFNEYDRDHNKQVDNVYVFYAGYGEADYDDPNTVWPHSWDLSQSGQVSPLLDGCYLEHYACSNEIDGQNSRPDGIGTFVHEFSHVMGLPDLYCTEYYQNAGSEPFTPGEFSVLDYGPYNNEGRTPPNYSAYERYALNWMTPEELTDTKNCKLVNLEDSNHAYLVKTEKDNEYFLFENRQQTGNDTYLPAHGMLIWHIDFQKSAFNNNTVNNSRNHQCVDLIEADGTQFDRDRNCDAFPGPLWITSFTPETNPRFITWSGKVPPVSIHHIDEDENEIISFRAVKPGDDPDEDPDNLSVGSFVGDDNIKIYVSGLELHLEGVAGECSIYDAAGRKIIASFSDKVVLPSAGIYLVKCGDTTYKIMAH